MTLQVKANDAWSTAGAQPWFSSLPGAVYPYNWAGALSAGPTPHTFGSWVHLGGLGDDLNCLMVNPGTVGANNTNTASVIQVGVGVDEVAEPSSVLFSMAVGGSVNQTFNVPVSVVADLGNGTFSSLWGRMQSAVINKAINLTIDGAMVGEPTAYISPTVDTYGIDLATSRGSSTTGMGTQYTATRAYRALALVPSCASATLPNGSGMCNAYVLDANAPGGFVDLGGISVTTLTTETIQQKGSGRLNVLPCDIPAGAVFGVSSLDVVDATIIGIP